MFIDELLQKAKTVVFLVSVRVHLQELQAEPGAQLLHLLLHRRAQVFGCLLEAHPNVLDFGLDRVLHGLELGLEHVVDGGELGLSVVSDLGKVRVEPCFYVLHVF